MRELAGRLSALDPEASETLKVIAYFDRLVDGRVGTESMLRGAAVISGATIGYSQRAQRAGKRFSADGMALPSGSADHWPAVSCGESAIVWLERGGEPHANDAMVLERLSIALSISTARLDLMAPSRRAVEVLLSNDATAPERSQAAARLSLAHHGAIHAVAVPATVELDHPYPEALMATRFGMVRAVLTTTDKPPAKRAGIGVVATSLDGLQDSWRSALTALRLSTTNQPVFRSAELGSLLLLAEAADQLPTLHPDAAMIGGLVNSNWPQELLDEVAAGASRRALAQLAGIHHSSMEARLQKLSSALGFDPLSATGRTRLGAALMLHRLATARFEDVEARRLP